MFVQRSQWPLVGKFPYGLLAFQTDWRHNSRGMQMEYSGTRTATTEHSRRLAAIMFTDMVGYSALAQANEQHALVLVGEQQTILSPTCAKYGGAIIKGTGDG